MRSGRKSTSTAWGGPSTSRLERWTRGGAVANGEMPSRQATVLRDQAERMRAKATKGARSSEHVPSRGQAARRTEGDRKQDRVASLRFPDPAPCGKVPLTERVSHAPMEAFEVFTDVDLAIDKGSRVMILGLNGAGKTTLLRILAGVDAPDTGVGGHRPRGC